MGKIPAKRKQHKGEDGGPAPCAGPPVHFLVCFRCGTVGAASIVSVHDAHAILRIVKRAQAEAQRQLSARSATASNSTEGTLERAPSLLTRILEDNDAKQTTLF